MFLALSFSQVLERHAGSRSENFLLNRSKFKLFNVQSTTTLLTELSPKKLVAIIQGLITEMKLLLKFQLLSQSAANLEQKNVRIQVDSPSTLREVAVLGMQKAGFDPEKVEISSATKGSHPTTVCLDDQPTDLGVYSVMLRERIKATSDCGAFWMSNVSSKNCNDAQL